MRRIIKDILFPDATIRSRVMSVYYDIVNAGGKILRQDAWSDQVRPGSHIRMQMRPSVEPVVYGSHPHLREVQIARQGGIKPGNRLTELTLSVGPDLGLPNSRHERRFRER